MDPLTEVSEYLFHFVLPDCFSTPLHSRGDLRVTREVNILGAVGDELHKTTTRHFCISLAEKKNSERLRFEPRFPRSKLFTRTDFRMAQQTTASQPFFTIRQTKRSTPEARTTLDHLHQVQISHLRSEQQGVESLTAQISDLKVVCDATTDVVVKAKREEEIEGLRRKREEWDTQKPLYDYFFETGEILYSYYDLQEKIQKGDMSGTVRFMKAKPGSVLAALQEGEAPTPTAAPGPKTVGREELLEKYLQKVDPEHARAVTNAYDDPHGICDTCEKEMMFSANEALFFCDGCGYQEFVLIDSDKPSYKDPPREVTYYAYKRINHFNEWLAQFQAKESTEIPEDVFQAILGELRKERLGINIKPAKIREILKKLKCTNFYEHVPYILNRINGETAPVMSREVEEKLRYMFKEIQPSFVKHCPKSRSNFLSYSYVLYKFCELLNLDEYLQCFPLLKNRDKLYNQDKIWEKICHDMGWQYIKSL